MKLTQLTKDLKRILRELDTEFRDRRSTAEYVEALSKKVRESGLKAEAYFEDMVQAVGEHHLEKRSKTSPIPSKQLALTFDPLNDLTHDEARRGIIRLGDSNFVPWADATPNDISVHLDQQIKAAQDIMNRSALTSTLLQSIIVRTMRDQGMTLEQAMQFLGKWLDEPAETNDGD